MNESILISLLKKFDKQMLKDFNAFVKSPYFNTNRGVVSLYEYIRKQYPEFSAEKLKKETVYRKIFGKTEYNDGFLRVLMSNLQNLAEEYLTFREVSMDRLLKKRFLLDQLSRIGDRKISEKIVKKELSSFEKIIPKGPEEYLGMYYIAFYNKYLFSTQFVVSKRNKGEEEMPDEQKYFTYYFLLRTLASHFYRLNQKEIINYEPKLLFLEEIITFLERNPEYLESPILNLTYLRVLLLKNNNLDDYYKLKNAFIEKFSLIDSKDAFNTVSIIINFCQKNYSETENELFLMEKFKILKFAVEHNINTFEAEEGFDGGRFGHIVATALEFNEVEWTERFILSHVKELNTESREFLGKFADAQLSFAKKNYDECLIQLSRLKNTTITTHKFNLKILQLKVFYEKNFWEQAESAADSFRHLIQNDKLLTEQYREAHRNFYSLFVKLNNIKAKSDPKGTEELKTLVQNTKPVIQKKWLIEKINESGS